MCKHILNAQVGIFAPCCRRFFDCEQCHAENSNHPLKKTMELIFRCKKCGKMFRKNFEKWEEADEFCPHCDNHFYIEAQTPEKKNGGMQTINIEAKSGDVLDARTKEHAALRKEAEERIKQTLATNSTFYGVGDLNDEDDDDM